MKIWTDQHQGNQTQSPSAHTVKGLIKSAKTKTPLKQGRKHSIWICCFFNNNTWLALIAHLTGQWMLKSWSAFLFCLLTCDAVCPTCRWLDKMTCVTGDSISIGIKGLHLPCCTKQNLPIFHKTASWILMNQHHKKIKSPFQQKVTRYSKLLVLQGSLRLLLPIGCSLPLIHKPCACQHNRWPQSELACSLNALRHYCQIFLSMWWHKGSEIVCSCAFTALFFLFGWFTCTCSLWLKI